MPKVGSPSNAVDPRSQLQVADSQQAQLVPVRRVVDAPVDQFDEALGHADEPVLAKPMPLPLFKNALRLEIEAKRTADNIFAVLTPSLYGHGCFEDIVAGFFANVVDKDQSDKKAKMREAEIIAKQERLLLAQQEKKRQEAQRQQDVAQQAPDALSVKDIKNQLKEVQNTQKQNQQEMQSLNQQMTQETQSISSMLSALHEARMNTIRQLRDGQF